MKSNEKNPFFSIIVPVYNTQDYVGACIDSVLNQSFKDYELILVDDGSTDSSKAICEDYTTNNSKIHLFRIPNQGSLHARCYGIKKSNGSHLVFLDSDDLLLPNALEIIANSFHNYSCDIVLYGWERIQNGVRVDSFQPAQENWVSHDKSAFSLKILCDHDYNSLCIKAVKRSLFDNTDYSPFYSIQRGEDLLQTIELLKNADSVAMIPDILYMYRMNLSSVTKNQDYDISYTIRDIVTSFVEAELYLGSSDMSKYYSHCAEDLINNVIRVIRSDLSKAEQNTLFKKYKASNTYHALQKKYSAKSLGWRCILLFAFSKNAYWFIRLIVSVYDWIRCH